MRVTDSDGRTWKVGRRWLPWRRRINDVPDLGDAGLGLDLDGDDPISAIISLGMLLIGLVILIPTLVVLAGLILELAALLALLPFVVLLRVALNQPWTIEVTGPESRVHRTEQVRGWQASRARIAEVAAQLRSPHP